jgi:hypothetical protein
MFVTGSNYRREPGGPRLRTLNPIGEGAGDGALDGLGGAGTGPPERCLRPEGNMGGGATVDPVRALIDSLPEEEARIRRKFWRDPAFRAVCEDHRDALQAIGQLEKQTQPTTERIEEYRALARELLAEAVDMLGSEKAAEAGDSQG